MFGLKGNNMKLAMKPTAQAKGKSLSKLTSPYYQEGTGSFEKLGSGRPAVRRIQSATNCRNTHSAKAMKNYRKQSEPIIQTDSIYQHRITTIESRTASITSFRGQMNPSELISGDKVWNRVRPLSASSSSQNSDVFELPIPIEFSNQAEFDDNNVSNEKNINDEILLSESDNLLLDVVSLCDEIGLDSSVIETIRMNGRRKKSQESSCSYDIGSDKSRMGQEMSKSRPTSQTSVPEIDHQKLSRPNSANSQLSQIIHGNGGVNENNPHPHSPKVQNESISKIISTLRLIEEEERKGCDMAAQFGDFFRQKLSPNPPNSSRQASLNSGRECCGDYNSQSARFQMKDTTPRLPPIHVPTESPTVHFQSGRSSMIDYEDDQQRGQSQYSPSPRIQQFMHNRENYPMPFVPVESTDEKAKNIFSFLDQVEKSDRDVLFNLKFDSRQGGPGSGRCSRIGGFTGTASTEFPTSIMDTLIRKGSVELAREVILLERKIEEVTQNITLLEESLMSQRELNVRNIKNSQRDLKKRLKIQQEEFELALSRHQTFVDQLIAEKRSIQDKCEKVLKESKNSDQNYQQQIKSIQSKHLEELKRIRKLQDNAEKCRKQKWVGSKTQEIRDMTVKGLEPEVQRIIQRHQQEMSEIRAWHSDELRETEERYSRKQTMRLQELRESFNREKDEACARERELAQKRFDSDLGRLSDEFECHKRRLTQEMNDEREKWSLDELKLKELMQENIRKCQIKGEVELDNMKQEYDTKITSLEKRHSNELKSLKDINENEKDNLIAINSKKFETMMSERENTLIAQFHEDKEKDLKEREKKLKDEFQKLWLEEEGVQGARIKRLQDKFQFELSELEKSESELKQKFSKLKSEVLAKDESIFTLKTNISIKEKQIEELSESNMKMLEDRLNLTSIIRREFTTQIEGLEDECKQVKCAVLELKAKQKLDLETHQMDLEKVRCEKDVELEKIGVRVKNALVRKEEAIQEFGKQLEKSQIRIRHLEQMLDQQRKDFVSSISAGESSSHQTKVKKVN